MLACTLVQREGGRHHHHFWPSTSNQSTRLLRKERSNHHVEKTYTIQSLSIPVFLLKKQFSLFFPHAAFPPECRPSDRRHVKRYIKELPYVPYNQARLTVCFSWICPRKWKLKHGPFCSLASFRIVRHTSICSCFHLDDIDHLFECPPN